VKCNGKLSLEIQNSTIVEKHELISSIFLLTCELRLLAEKLEKLIPSKSKLVYGDYFRDFEMSVLMFGSLPKNYGVMGKFEISD